MSLVPEHGAYATAGFPAVEAPRTLLFSKSQQKEDRRYEKDHHPGIVAAP
jgi:hypothetical protein